MDNQISKPEYTPEQSTLDSAAPLSDNSFVSQYGSSNGVYSTESLEVNDGTSPVPPPQPSYTYQPKLNFSKRKALIVSVAITAAVGLLMGGSLILFVRKDSKNHNSSQTGKQQDVNLRGADQSTIPSELQGASESLLVNGDVITRSNLKISNGGFVTTIRTQNIGADQTITLPSGSGTLCLDSNNCSYAANSSVTALQQLVNTLQAQVSAIGPVPTAGVDSINNQKGAVTIQGSTNRINVSTANGIVTVSTSQDLDANANVQFNSLAVSPTGQIVSNTLAQTSAGNNIAINAGADSIIFSANGRTYQLPNSGIGSQIICTTVTCGSSGGDVTATTPGVANRIALFTAGNDITSSWLAQNGATLELDSSYNLSVLGGNITANGTVSGTQLISTVSSGTAPLTVTSNTLVTNLNADLLDGQHGSYYQDASNLTAGLVPSARISGVYSGITGVGTITSGTWNGTALTDTYVSDNLTVSSAGTVDWAALNNYPAGCSAGQAVTALSDSSLGCTTFAAGSGSGNYVQNQNSSDQAADFRISGTGRANTALVTPALRPVSDSTSALKIQNANGSTDILTVDTTNGRIGIGTVPTYKLQVADTSTANSGTSIGAYVGLAVNPSSPPSGAAAFIGTSSITSAISSNVNANTQLFGTQSVASNISSGNLGGAVGISGRAENISTGSIAVAIGLQGLIVNSGSGNIAIGATILAASPAVSAGSITDQYGLYIDTQKVAGVTNGYGVYQLGTNDINYFAGRVGIGESNPLSLFSVGSGSAFQINNSGQVIVGTWHGSAIGFAYGGTGLTAAPTNGQLLIGNGSGYTLTTLSNSDGTVDIINGPGSIEISVPRADKCTECADNTLSNLADIVAINKSLLPATAGTIDLGGSSVPYSKLYLSGTSSSPASNNFTITGNATSSRTINLPDADGTICLLESCVRLQSGSPGTQQTGHINISGNVLATNLVLGGSATVNTLAPAASTALTLGATGAGQTTSLQGNSISFTNGTATYSFNSTSGVHTLCDDSGNCAGTGGGVIASGGSAYNLPVFTSANTISNSIFSQNAGATAATIAGTLQVTGATITGSGALTVSSTGGGNVLNLSSGSGTLGLTGTTNIIQRVGNSLTLDINSGANSTLTITNSNGGFVANLTVEGGLNIGSGQTYKINNVDINTGGTLNNVAYLNQANNFTNIGTTSFGGPITAGTYNSQTISAAANLTGTLDIQGASALRLGAASSNTGAILFRNNAGSNTVTLKAADSNPLSSFTFTLPSALPVSTECLNLSNTGTIGTQSCASGLGGSGTQNYIAKFGVGGASVEDSSISDDGTDVVIQGGSLILGKNGSGGIQGILSLRNGANPGKTVSVAAPTSGVSSDYTLVLPDDSASDGQCLVLSTTGQNRSIITGSCAAGGSGGNLNASGTGSAVGRLQRVTAYNSGTYTGGLSQIYDNGTTVGVGVTQGAALLTVGSEADFTVSDGGAVTADGLSLNGSGSNSSITNVLDISGTGSFTTNKSGAALQLTGAPQASATTAQMQLGSALVSGSIAGTYIGVNASNGYTGDFVNLQVNGVSKLKIDKDGNVTSGTINGVTLGGSGALSSGGYTLTLTGNSTLNQNLTTSSTVQFGTLNLTNALSASNGGTGNDTSGAQAGAALIFNATTGKFEANRIISSDTSILVGNTDGNIDLVVNSCTTCAKTDLSNLAATTNINSTLRAQTGVDLGAAANPFRELYIYGSSSTPASNNFKLTGTATALRTITLPDTSGTACLTTTCVTLQGGGHTPQNGYIDISNDLNVGGNFTLGGSATVNTLAPAASTPLLLGATGSGQTSRLQGTAVTFVSGGITYNFSHSGSGTHTICDDTGNCAGAGGGVTASGGAAFSLPVFNSSNTLVNSLISQDAGAGATIATVNGKLAVAATNTSGTSLAVSNSALNGNNSNLAHFSFTNANSTASATTVNGIAVSPTGSVNGNSNANTLNGIRLNNVTPVTNNSFYAINVGTGYNDILRLNSTSLINGSGYLQNAALDSALTYSNLTKVGTITVGTWNGTALTDTYVNDNITISSAGTVDWAALNNYPTACSAGQAVTQLSDASLGCTTFAGGSGSGNYIQNQNASQQSASNFWISNTGRADVSVLTPTVDTATATTLNIGNTTASSITLGRSGITTTSNGNFAVANTGNVAFQRNTTGYTVTGSQDLTIGTGVLFRVTSATSAPIVTGISGGADGRIVTLVNASGNSFAINNNASGTPANYVTTGTGTNMTVPNGSSIQLAYDSASSVWRVIGDAADAGCSTCASTDLSNITGTNVGAAINKTAGNLNLTTTSSGNIVLNSAGTIELQDNTNITGTLNTSGNFDTDGSLTVGTANQFVISNAGVVTSGTWNGSVITAVYGGTGQSTTAVGDLLIGAGGNTWNKLAIGGNGNCLVSNGTTASWTSCTATTLQGAYTASSTAPTAAEIILADTKDIRFTTSATASAASVVMRLACTTCGTGATGNFLVQNGLGSFDALFSVAGNGAIQIGGGNGAGTYGYISLGGSGGKTTGSFTLNGTARNAKSIILTPEYAGAVLDNQDSGGANCTANFNGTMTSGFDTTNRSNYYSWLSSQTGNQCYDVVVQVPMPTDWSAWNTGGGNSIDIQMITNDASNSAYAVGILDTNGSADANYGAAYTSPGTLTTSWADMATSDFSGTYAASDSTTTKYLTIKIRMTSKNSANLKLGNITLRYLSKF